jgi:heme A synthase
VRAAYRVLATLVMAGVVLQVAFMAFGAFGLAADAEDGVTVDGSYRNLGQNLHGLGGMVIALLVLVLLIVSFFARVPRGRTLAGVLVVLVALQFVLATSAYGLPALGALHGLNGLAIAGVAGVAARRAAAMDEDSRQATVAGV